MRIKPFLPPIILLAAHAILLQAGFYEFIPWFDSVMHFIGGITLGMMFTQLFDDKLTGKEKVLFVVMFSLIIATGWEIFEYIMDPFTSDLLQPGVFDTVKDLVLGGLGAGITATLRSC
ncbi:hypothetical protein HY489_01550 [Candidatus Woesearchaeota archaeon]|nr:hypothetical protein [Candidatus Woesearchaeota archaeon]